MLFRSKLPIPSASRRTPFGTGTSFGVWVGLVFIVTAATARAQVPPAPSPSPQAPIREQPRLDGDETPKNAEDHVPENAPEEAALEAEEKPCTPRPGDSRAWVDRVQRGLYRAVCASSRWFDGLFGDTRFDEEYNRTHGRLMVGVNWDDHEGLSDEIRFHAEYELPQAERRLRAFIGREDRKDVVTDREQRTTRVSDFLSFDEDEEWLVGLGYSPLRSARSRFDVDLGMDFQFPMNPYLKLRYRHVFPRGEYTLWRFRQTVFWENEDGVGTTTRLDFEHLLRPNLLVRFRNVGVLSEATRGVDWYSELTFYQGFGDERAFGYRASARGETDLNVGVRDLALQVIYRERFLRDWLFLDIEPGVVWRRRELHDPRDVVPILVVGLEIAFGQGQ